MVGKRSHRMRFVDDVPGGTVTVSFGVDASARRHWRVSIDREVATVEMVVDPDDVVQRLRFEHPEVRAVVLTGGLDKVFCAGANIRMLAGSTHSHKVNFCKF